MKDKHQKLKKKFKTRTHKSNRFFFFNIKELRTKTLGILTKKEYVLFCITLTMQRMIYNSIFNANDDHFTTVNKKCVLT